MTTLDMVLCLVPVCSTWDRLNVKLFSAHDRTDFKLVVQEGSISWRLHRQAVDEVMTQLDTVLRFVPLCSTWDRPNGKSCAARDRSSFELIVQLGSISWRHRRQGVDGVTTTLDTVLCFVPMCSTWDRLNV